MQITAPVLVVPATGPARGRPVNIGLNIKYNDRNLNVCGGRARHPAPSHEGGCQH